MSDNENENDDARRASDDSLTGLILEMNYESRDENDLVYMRLIGIEGEFKGSDTIRLRDQFRLYTTHIDLPSKLTGIQASSIAVDYGGAYIEQVLRNLNIAYGLEVVAQVGNIKVFRSQERELEVVKRKLVIRLTTNHTFLAMQILEQEGLMLKNNCADLFRTCDRPQLWLLNTTLKVFLRGQYHRSDNIITILDTGDKPASDVRETICNQIQKRLAMHLQMVKKEDDTTSIYFFEE